MNCRMTRGVYLRANGEINCYCSTGEQVTLTHLPLDRDDWNFVNDFYMRGRFSGLRKDMARGVLPFPVQCVKCNYLLPHDSFDADAVDTEIEWLHAEAAAVCNLRCPFCVHGIPLEERTYTRPKPHILPRELYSKMLRDVKDAGMNFKWMYFSGRGEPGLHPQLWEMVTESKDMFDTNFLINTNGNIPYNDAIVDSGLDKIKIALDSLDQETYARYRRGGEVDTLLKLTRGIADRKAALGVKNPTIIWQIVLFDYNDSDEHLERYQRVAQEMGVDRIRLVFTYTEGFSSRRPSDVPMLFPDIEVLDSTQRDNLPLEDLERRLANLKDAPDLGHAMSLASRIMKWFNLGVEDRDAYNAYANLPPYAPELLRLREGDPLLDKYVGGFVQTMETLVRVYETMPDCGDAARMCADWAKRMPGGRS